MSKQKTNNQSKDFNRLSSKTISKLFRATYDAMQELQGDGDLSDAVRSDLYCALWPLSIMASNHSIKRIKANHHYEKMKMHELLKELYIRLQMYHHYGECKSRDLPGIAWHMEPTGVFAITLNDCAVNMECDMQDDVNNEEGTLFCISLNLPLLESEDPENPESPLADEYEKFVTFTCYFSDSKECRDVNPLDTYRNVDALSNILGCLDLISEMNNNENK